MENLHNYLETALKYPEVFRALLLRHGINIGNHTVEELFEAFSSGERYGKWTVLNFKHVKDNIFEFTEEDIEYLSGSGSQKQYSYTDGVLKLVNTISVWMS